MKKTYLTCPFCMAHLAVSETEVREKGMCPACDSIFELDAAQHPGSGAAQRTTAVAPSADSRRAGLLAVLLTVLGLCALLSWTPAGSAARGLTSGTRAALLAGSLLCAFYVLAAAVGGKNIVPGALAACAWGLGSGVWVIGALVAAGQASPEGGALSWPFYASVAVAFVVFLGGAFFLVRSPGRKAYSRLPVVLIAILVVAGALGGLGAHRTVARDYGMLRAAPPPPEPSEQRPQRGGTRGARREQNDQRNENGDDEEEEKEPPREPEDPAEARSLPQKARAVTIVEAESAPEPGAWGVERGKSASEKRYLQWHGPEQSRTNPPEENLLRYEVEVPRDGRYSLYADMITPDPSSDSLWVRFEQFDADKSEGIVRDDGWVMVWTGVRQDWGWVPIAHQDAEEPVIYQLEKGTQTFIIGWREVGIRLDRIALVRAR